MSMMNMSPLAKAGELPTALRNKMSKGGGKSQS